jgi:hypothetical protein
MQVGLAAILLDGCFASFDVYTILLGCCLASLLLADAASKLATFVVAQLALFRQGPGFSF